MEFGSAPGQSESAGEQLQHQRRRPRGGFARLYRNFRIWRKGYVCRSREGQATTNTECAARAEALREPLCWFGSTRPLKLQLLGRWPLERDHAGVNRGDARAAAGGRRLLPLLSTLPYQAALGIPLRLSPDRRSRLELCIFPALRRDKWRAPQRSGSDDRPGAIMMTCPICGSKRVSRSRRRGFVEKTILSLIFIKPFRCEACDSRFLRSSRTSQPASTHAPIAR